MRFPEQLEDIYIEKITKEMVHTFGVVANDMNPIHFDEQVARLYGYENCIAHGMLVCGLSTKLISPWLDATHIVRNFETTFLHPLMINDSLKITGKVRKNTETEAIIELVALNQNNVEIIRAMVEIEGGKASCQKEK